MKNRSKTLYYLIKYFRSAKQSVLRCRSHCLKNPTVYRARFFTKNKYPPTQWVDICLVQMFLQDLMKNTVKSRVLVPKTFSQKGGSDSEPSESALASEQASRACLFAKKEEQRHERTLIFYKKIRASDIQLALTWSE